MEVQKMWQGVYKMNEKVGLRKQPKKKTGLIKTIQIDNASIDVWRDVDGTIILGGLGWIEYYDYEKREVKPFLESSPQTREILRLLAIRPPHEWMIANLDKIEVVENWFITTIPKLEALLADHVSREKLRKLIEDFRTIDTRFNDDSKIILDEIERGVYSSQKDVFDNMFDIANDSIQKIIERLELLTEKGDSPMYELKVPEKCWCVKCGFEFVELPDEYYNMNFKLYEHGYAVVCGNCGSKVFTTIKP